ncbi:hypothetical protein EU527_05115 [Candidatus Thorarchaeota archaeon]|nr:MAG: hypothetical protein EU527_05115 [Candidatus Thorarchaeota archaeon]
MWKRKRIKTIEDVSVTELLDDFVELEEEEDTGTITKMDDEEYVAMMLKKEALKTLQKHRKDVPTTPFESPGKRTQKPEPPVVSGKLSIVKRCQNCYYCIGSHTINSSVWCHCTNPGRSIEEEMTKSWIKSRLNLPCWKPVPA